MSWSRSEWQSLIAVVCSGLFTLVYQHALLFRSALPIGIDGFYYLIQVRSLRGGESAPFVEQHTLAVHLLAFITRFGDRVGIMDIEAIKLAVCVAYALMVVAALVAGRRLFRLDAGSLYVSGLMLNCVAMLKFLSIEYFANLLGILACSCAACCWSIATGSNSPIRRIFWVGAAALCLTSALLMHASTIVFLGATAIVILASHATVCRHRLELVAAVVFCWIGIAFGIAWVDRALWSNALTGGVGLANWNLGFVAISLLACCSAMTRSSKASASLSARALIERRYSAALLAACVVTVVLAVNPFGDYSTRMVGAAERISIWGAFLAALTTPGVVVRGLRDPSRVARASALLLSGVACYWIVKPNRVPVALSDTFMEMRAHRSAQLPALLAGVPPSMNVVAEHGIEFEVAATGHQRTSSFECVSLKPGDARLWLMTRAESEAFVPRGDVLAQSTDYQIVRDKAARRYMKLRLGRSGKNAARCMQP